MIWKQGGGFVTPRIGLGYVPSQPVKISGWRKVEQSLVQYITTEEADNEGPKVIGVWQIAAIDITSTTFCLQEDGKGQDS